jgi:hypothetical protein
MLLGRRDKYFTHVLAKLRGGLQARRKLDQAEVLNHESSYEWAQDRGSKAISENLNLIVEKEHILLNSSTQQYDVA